MPAEIQTVLHVTEVLGGGVEHAISRYIATLGEVEHVILAPADGGLSTVENARFIPMSTRRVSRVADVRRAVEQVAPSLVHAHSSWAGVRARATRLGVPVAYQPHAFAFYGYASSGLGRTSHRVAEKTLARRAASFLTLSEHESALARGLTSVVPVQRVVNVSGIDKRHHGTWTLPDAPSVAMAGRIAPQKDPDFYVRFAARLRSIIPHAAVTWIGDGDAGARHGLEQAGIEVTGWLSQTEVAERLARTSLYVHSARYEGFPLSVLDAAAVGMPIVLRRTPSTAGVDLLQAESSDGLAELSASVLLGDALTVSTDMTHALHERHSPSAQRDSLLSAYAVTLGGRAAVNR